MTKSAAILKFDTEGEVRFLRSAVLLAAFPASKIGKPILRARVLDKVNSGALAFTAGELEFVRQAVSYAARPGARNRPPRTSRKVLAVVMEAWLKSKTKSA